MEHIKFPIFSGVRCLMMPYVQGDPSSIPDQYRQYADILKSVFIQKGDIGFLTIDESFVKAGEPQRGARAKFNRALHTEAGRRPGNLYVWGGGWGSKHIVTLKKDTEILLASNISHSCAIWDSTHTDTSLDGDIGHESDKYPYSAAKLLKAGEVAKIGIFTPHESLRLKTSANRQFIRIVGKGVHGREEYFTENPLVGL